jgi:predicted RNA-binding Zn-ribbon protein involved in translation (DUF1610 family)
MARGDYPLCIHCDNSSHWFISHDAGQTVYHCYECGNTVVVESTDG